MSALLDPLRLVSDERPPVDEDTPRCVDCGAELEYKGTGRRPTKCDEHRKKRGGDGGAKAAGPASANEKLAAQATDMLCQLNDVGAIIAMMFGLAGTAGQIAERQEPFRGQAHQALLLDPALARSIVRGGAKSGTVALIMAYGMLIGSVAPTAVVEIRELRAARAAAAPAPEEGEPA